MTVKQWIEEVHRLIGRISGDRELSDEGFLEVLSEMSELATASYNAKQEELER